MITNFGSYVEQLEKMNSIIGASKSSDIVGTKFRSLLSISGDIQLGADFKESLSAEQLTKFSWLKDDDLTIRGGIITVEGLDQKPKAFWLNTAILSMLVKAKALTKKGDVKAEFKGVTGEFMTDSVKFAKVEKTTEDDDE